MGLVKTWLGRISATLILMAAMAVSTYAEDVEPSLIQYPKYEVRAVWLTTLGGLDWPRTRALTPGMAEKQKGELSAMLDELQAAGINTILFQTRIRATVVYPSAIEPWDECLTGSYGRNPGYDPLAFAVDECHKRGMEIQAWVVAIPAGRWNSYGCRTLRRKRPGLVVRRGDEGYIDPASRHAASYIADICREIASRYDVDGIHLDYIRYPETWDGKVYNGRKRRNAAKPDLGQIQAITNIVSAVSRAVKQEKPWMKLSCATIGKHADLPRRYSNGWNALVRGRQDAQEWLRKGIVDQLYPMIYFRGNDFYPFALDWSENRYDGQAVAGIAAYMLSTGYSDWPLSEIGRQMYVARTARMGYAIFRARHLCENTKGLLDFVKGELNMYPALVPPMATGGPQVPPPTQLRIKKDAARLLLAWDGPRIDTAHSGGLAYNIYADEHCPVDISDARNLIAMRIDSCHMDIKTMRNLHFAVTAVDRYGNESQPLRCLHNQASTYRGHMLANDGKTLILPASALNAGRGYVAVKSLTGTIVATRAYGTDGNVDIGSLAPGCYTVHSIDKKGNAHRLGFVMIK